MNRLKISSLITIIAKYRNLIILIVSFFSALVLCTYTYTESGFYYFLQYQILKQQEKIDNDAKDLKYYDIVSYNAFCNTTTFKLYMSRQPIVNQLMIQKVCKEIQKKYESLDSDN